MQPGRDIAIFVGLVAVFSTAIAFVARDLLTENALFAVAVASVILAARGAEWKRKLPYAAIALGGLVASEQLTVVLGLGEYMGGFGVEAAATALGVAYIAFTLTFPLAVLLLFVGRDPSVLWSRRVDPGSTNKQRSSVR